MLETSPDRVAAPLPRRRRKSRLSCRRGSACWPGRNSSRSRRIRRAEAERRPDRSVLDDWWKLAAAAEVPHVHGRSAYGAKRTAVDGARRLGISREALMQHGGWSHTQMPDRTTRTRSGLGAGRARDVRAKIRRGLPTWALTYTERTPGRAPGTPEEATFVDDAEGAARPLDPLREARLRSVEPLPRPRRIA